MTDPSDVGSTDRDVGTRTRTAATGWSFHRTLVVLGFVAAVAAFLAVTGANVATMTSPTFAPFVVVVALAAVLTVAVTVRETPGRLLTAGVAVSLPALIVLGLLGEAPMLMSPLGDRPFVAYHLLLLSLALGMPAGIQGYRTRRRGAPLPGFYDGMKTGHGLAALAVAVATLTAAGVATLAASELPELTGEALPAYDFTPDATVVVEVESLAFPTEPLAMRAGDVTEVVVENHDTLFHTFTYAADGERHDHDLPAGASVTFLVRFDAAGTISYWCEPHSEGPDGQRTGMVGAIEVT